MDSKKEKTKKERFNIGYYLSRMIKDADDVAVSYLPKLFKIIEDEHTLRITASDESLVDQSAKILGGKTQLNYNDSDTVQEIKQYIEQRWVLVSCITTPDVHEILKKDSDCVYLGDNLEVVKKLRPEDSKVQNRLELAKADLVEKDDHIL